MAMRVKHICLDMLKELGHYESWDVIPQETLEKAQTRSLARADRALSRPAYSLARPSRCGGGFLTKHLRNGQALCVKFQTGRCSSREMQHKCAALMQTGRACGGAHPAAECRSKRMLKEPPVQRAAEGPSSVPVLPELKAVSLSDGDDEASSEESVVSEVEVEEPAPKRPRQQPVGLAL